MNKPNLHDRIALWVLRLARWHKTHFSPSVAEEFYQEYFEEEAIEAYQRDVRQILRRQEIANWVTSSGVKGTVIDIGCGVGDVLQVFEDRFKRIGTDYALTQLSLSRALLKGGADFLQASVYQLPFRDNFADIIVCLEVIEHLEHDDYGAREISRILKPGGYLIAAVPNQFYWNEYLELMGHWRHYSYQSFQNLLSKAGIQILSSLKGYQRLQRLYFYIYITLKILSLFVNRISKTKTTVYSLCLPWSKRPLYDVVVLFFLWLAKYEKISNYKNIQSTFVVAQKEFS